MPKPNPHRPFIPDPEQKALQPVVSGNVINGLHEQARRPPRMVYWAPDPNDIPHGALQNYFYRQSARTPGFSVEREKRQKILDAPLPPVADHSADHTPLDWTTGLNQFIQNNTCEKIGVAQMNPDWVYQGHTISQSRVIIVGVQHAYDQISTAPEPTAGVEVMIQYARAAKAAKDIAGWIRNQGWDAEPVTGPMTGALTMIPPALACGFGELGKHGSIINPDLGASFRLSAVLTDAPFAPTPPQDYGIDDFCQNCRICEDACPPEALNPHKQTVRGTQKWYVDFDKCLPYFNQSNGCAICIAVCPWSRPGVGLNLAAKLARRSERRASENM
jgi:ferredoxin